MVWTPKSTAPATFNLADAFLALITGDPVWGWLVDWLPYVTNDHFNTAEFCAGGPPTAAQITPGVFNMSTAINPEEQVALLIQRQLAIYYQARDRVFGAFCQQPGTPGVMTWSNARCAVMDATALAGGWGFCATDIDAPWDSLRVASVVSTGGAGQIMVGTGTGAAALRALGSFGGTGGTAVPYESGGPAPAGDTSVWLAQSSGGATNGTVCVQFGHLGAGIPHDPTPQPEPAGLLSPLRDVPPTLDGIAAEVMSLEFKLDTLLTIVQAVAGSTLDLGGPPSDPADLAPDTEINLKDAAGVVLVATGVPASRSLDFGTPQNIVKLAQINVGDVNGWYPSVWMTHTPFVLRPLPQGVTRLTLTDITPGVSITSRLISKTK